MGGTERLDSSPIESSPRYGGNSQRLNMGHSGEFPISIEEDFFGVVHGGPDDGSDDEEQLIKDGNAQVLKNFEVRRKDREYSRSQPVRGTKQSGISMSGVDWSGFPGAAHVKTKSPRVKSDRQSRRRSLTHADPAAERERQKEHRAALQRAQRRMSANGAEPLASPPQSPPVSPLLGRSRRLTKINGHMSVQSFDITSTRNRSPRRSGTENGASLSRSERSGTSGSNTRPQRRRSIKTMKMGSQSQLSQSQMPVAPKSSRRSSRSSSPGPGLRHTVSPGHLPGGQSPSSRMRRTVAAAASSTLEVRESRKNRSSSNGRANRRQTGRTVGVGHDEHLLQKAKSLRW